MSEPGSQAVAASSGLEGERLEELQFGLGEGPGHEAFSHGRPVFEGDLRAAFGRWPGYAPAAVSAGVCGVFAFPLHQGAVRFGVLTMYSSVIRSLEDHELSQGLIFADVATGLLLDSSVFGAGDRAGAGLDAALRIRSEVYQAQGMVMVDLQVSLAEALARMRAHAYARGQDLDELAQGIVTGRLSMSQDEA